MNPSKRLDRAVTSEMETYNKLYTRMLCLIVEKFHFEVKEVDFVNVVDERMALLAEDALSARALKQVEFMKKKEKPVKPEEKKSEEKGEEKMEVEKEEKKSEEGVKEEEKKSEEEKEEVKEEKNNTEEEEKGTTKENKEQKQEEKDKRTEENRVQNTANSQSPTQTES